MKPNEASFGSVLSFPDRGPWGNSRYPGNWSGFIPLRMMQFYQPKKVADYTSGGGTTRDVARELGIEGLFLDLNPVWGGFNLLKDDPPESADMIFLHLPYHNIIRYSGNAWGQESHPDDLSNCKDYADFISKSNLIHYKLMLALRKGGRLVSLIGDVRGKNIPGGYACIMRDMTWPGKPEQVLVKIQHNCSTDAKAYTGRKFIPIQHEYLLVFRRDDTYLLPLKTTQNVNIDLRQKQSVSWRYVVYAALEKLGGRANLSQLYSEIDGHAKCRSNSHWQEKVRQILQVCPDFSQAERGVWKFAHSTMPTAA